MVDRSNKRNVEVPSTYRDTTLGQALETSLDSLLNSGEINQLTKDNILKTYDLSILETFKDLQGNRNTKISGKSISYNNVEDIWRFKLDSLEIKDDFFKESSNLCNLVARSADNNPVE